LGKAIVIDKTTKQSILSEEIKERIIEPYFIEPAAFGHSSYVIGYCHLKKSMRTFKIERIKSAEILDKKYTIPKDFDANKLLQSSWGIIADGEIKTIKMKIKDRDMIRLMQETIWHPTQQFEKRQDGSTVMTLHLADTCEFISWVLGWGERIEVLEPAELREQVIDTVRKMQKIYREK
jgi:predicted DNA-binding transcriptional regulator YafY